MGNPSLLDELISDIAGMSVKDQEALALRARKHNKGMVWLPQVGPQTEAYFSEADELFYGGEAGGGKTDLGLGLSLTDHNKALCLRRITGDARKLCDRVELILGHTTGRNLSPSVKWSIDGRMIDFAGCQYEADKQRFKGDPHDLIFFDEISDFLKSQFDFIKGWNRSTVPGQRCRIVCAGNPPTTPEGLWVIEYWAPWLDPRHSNPALDGELRHFVVDKNDKSHEVPGKGKYQIVHNAEGLPTIKRVDDAVDDRAAASADVEIVRSKSRTFIRAGLKDNAYLRDTDYGANLDSLPAEIRSAYRDGRFDLSLKDNPWQIIPTSWILAAIKRWRPNPPPGVPMCAMGVDPAQGGDDNTVIAPRYDGWYDLTISLPGKQTPMGSDIAAIIISKRRDKALPIIDMGGGYGGGVIQSLHENNIPYYAYKGSEKSHSRTKDGKLRFKNTRTAAYWKFREALDPDQTGGSPISLPDNPRLIADLSAPTFKIVGIDIVAESKEDVVSRLGRSPDDGDAVVMAWVDGAKAVSHGSMFQGHGRPEVKMGHSSQRRSR